MAVCKQCGTSFTPTPEAPGCPQCSSAVRRRVRPAGEAAQAPRPTAARPRAVQPAAKPAGAKAAPARAKAARATVAPVEHEERVHHHAEPEGLIDNTTKYGLLATLGLAIIVGTTVLIVMRKKSAEAAERERYEAEVSGIQTQLQSLDVSDPAGAEAVLAMVEDKKNLWVNHDRAADIELLVSRAKAKLEADQEERETVGRFGSLEEELKKTEIPLDRMKDIRRQLDELEVRLAGEGPELMARFAAARVNADKSFAARMLADAESFAAANAGNPRQALARFQPVEDEIKAMLDRAYHDKKQDLQDYYTPLYQEAIKGADAVAEELFKKEGETLPWIDCLVPPQASNWNASTVAGFSHQVQNGVLQLVGPDADAGKMAVISIGDREQWRHFQLDFELTIDKGDLESYYRLGRNPTNNTLSYPLRTVKNANTDITYLEAGRRYRGRVTVVGSKFNVHFEGAGEDLDVPSVHEEIAKWPMSRKGAIGLVLLPESRARITKFQVREIR